MRKVGNMRVGPSEKTIHEEEVKKKAIENYKKQVEESYAKAGEGIIEWLGDREVEEDKKYKSENETKVFIIQIRYDKDDSKYRTILASYFMDALQGVYKAIIEMNNFLKEDEKIHCKMLSVPEEFMKNFEPVKDN